MRAALTTPTYGPIVMLTIPDEDPDPSYLYQEGLFEDRRAEYERGDFSFVGVQAATEIRIPHGEGWITQTVTSPGLWGIEDDSGHEYLNDVYEDEKLVLLDMLAALGASEES